MKAFDRELAKGCDPTVWPYPVRLEPPFARERDTFEYPPRDPDPIFPDRYTRKQKQTVFVAVSATAESENHVTSSERVLTSLTGIKEPISFELLGNRDRVSITLVAAKRDVRLIENAVRTSFYGLAFEPTFDPLLLGIRRLKEIHEDLTFDFLDFYPAPPFFYPLTCIESFKDTDPLEGLYQALATMTEHEIGLLQVLFIPCRHDWQTRIRELMGARSVVTRSSHPSLPDWQLKEFSALMLQKIDASRPLFACAVRVAAFGSKGAVLSSLKSLKGGLAHFLQAGKPLRSLTRKDFASSLRRKDHLTQFLNRVSFRTGMIVNSGELAFLTHFPYPAALAKKLYPFRVVKTVACPPESVLGVGSLIGEATFEGRAYPIHIPKSVRNRHMFLLGKTRTGKSTLIRNMVVQDLKAGDGLAVIDPTGDLIEQEILPLVPKERMNDVIYLNAADWRDAPFSLNVLDPQGACVSDIVDDVVSFLRMLHADSWGPQMEDILKMSIETLLAVPGRRILKDVNRLLLDPQYREAVTSNLTDPDVLHWWRIAFPPLIRRVNPVLNKIRDFIFHEKMRSFFDLPDNSVNFRSVLDERKVLLCNLSKHVLKEENARFLGGLIISKILTAALARAENQASGTRPDFYLYIDECHNFQLPSIRTILSEGAKFRLNLILATQYLKQLIPDIRNAVLGNIGTLVCFRVSEDVASDLRKTTSRFDIHDYLDLDVGEAVVMADKASDSFLMRTHFEPVKEAGPRDEIIATNRLRFSAERAKQKEHADPKADSFPSALSEESFYE